MAIADKLLVCPSCRKLCHESTRFCPVCGARLVASDEDTVARAWNRQNPADPMTEETQPRPARPARIAPRPPESTLPAARSDRRMLLALSFAAVIVLVLLGVGLYVGGVFSAGSGAGASGDSTSPRQTSIPATPAPTTAAPVAPSSTSTAPTPPTASTPASAPQPSQANTSYLGQSFSIQYPTDWSVTDAEVQHSYGTDTTIVSPTDPNTLLKVDVTANSTATDPLAAAQPVISALAQQPGYSQIDLTAGTFQGYPAEHWEFVVKESGVLLHKEDEFFIDTVNGDGVAVLTQAPADQYSALASRFAALRQTLSMN